MVWPSTYIIIGRLIFLYRSYLNLKRQKSEFEALEAKVEYKTFCREPRRRKNFCVAFAMVVQHINIKYNGAQFWGWNNGAQRQCSLARRKNNQSNSSPICFSMPRDEKQRPTLKCALARKFVANFYYLFPVGGRTHSLTHSLSGGAPNETHF